MYTEFLTYKFIRTILLIFCEFLVNAVFLYMDMYNYRCNRNFAIICYHLAIFCYNFRNLNNIIKKKYKYNIRACVFMNYNQNFLNLIIILLITIFFYYLIKL